MLLVFVVLLLQAKLLHPCMLTRTMSSFNADIKYKITTYKNFDDCAKACFYDEDCVYVSYEESSEPPKNTTCTIYKKGLTKVSAQPKAYRMNRTEEDTSSATCSSRPVQCAAKQNYEPIKDKAASKPDIEESQCPPNATIITLNVYTDKGYHAYAVNETGSPMSQYTKKCSMKFLGVDVQACNSVPIYTRGDYRRLFFGDAYQKPGYSKTGMYVLPQQCFYNGTEQCYSSVKINEYHRTLSDDFIYTSSVKQINKQNPADQYIRTEVTQDFWIVDSDCSF